MLTGQQLGWCAKAAVVIYRTLGAPANEQPEPTGHARHSGITPEQAAQTWHGLLVELIREHGAEGIDRQVEMYCGDQAFADAVNAMVAKIAEQAVRCD